MGTRRPVAGLLLTGGASRRMGTDKARLVVDGRPLAERAVEVLAQVCDPVVEVGDGISGFPAVREDPPGQGPLAALVAGGEALARSGHAGPLLLLAVDMPFAGADLLRLLAERPGPVTAVPLAGGRPQPLCARYGADAVATASGLLATGERSLRALLGALEAERALEWVEPAEWEPVAGPDAFRDLDTPHDLDRLLGKRHHGGHA